MKKRLLVGIFLIFSPALCAPNYQEQFYTQWDQKDFREMEKTLESWKKSNPDDPELSVAYGNYFHGKAEGSGPEISQQPLAKQTDGVRYLWPEQGSSPSSRSFPLDRPLALQAASYWRKGLQANPWRLDLYFNLAGLYQSLGDFESQYGVLAQALQYADKGWKQLRWIGNQKLSKRSSKMIPEQLQGYTAYYLSRNDRVDGEKARRLARLSMTFYPNCPYAYDSMAAYFSFQEDWPHTMKYLLIAQQKAPQDSLILCNIGNTLVKIGKKKEARIYYRKVVELKKDPESLEIAEKYLKSGLRNKP